jgi:hypothetical protein
MQNEVPSGAFFSVHSPEEGETRWKKTLFIPTQGF